VHYECVMTSLWRGLELSFECLHVESWLATLIINWLIKSCECERRNSYLALLAVCEENVPSRRIKSSKVWCKRERRLYWFLLLCLSIFPYFLIFCFPSLSYFAIFGPSIFLYTSPFSFRSQSSPVLHQITVFAPHASLPCPTQLFQYQHQRQNLAVDNHL